MELRQKVLSGGAVLAVRQGVGLILNLTGLAILTRLIGPTDYGIYVTVFAIVSFISVISSFGVGAYLIRSENELVDESYQVALTLLLIMTLAVALIAIAVLPVLGIWFDTSQFTIPLAVMFLTLPLTAAAIPAGAKIERELNYRAIAGIELAGQIVFLALGMALAMAGAGVYALVLGYFAQQVVVFGTSSVAARTPFRLHFDADQSREMIGYGMGFSASQMIWNGRALLIPILVGMFAGINAVAFVNLATRLVEAMTLSRRIFWRLAMAALAKIQSDRMRLQRVLNEAMSVQVLATGPPLCAVSLFGPWLLPKVVGPEWDGALIVFPFIALATMVNSLFQMQSAVLYITRRNWWVALFHATNVLLITVGIVLFVPQLGLIGYGWAEMLAMCSYLTLHVAVSRTYSISYRAVFPWLIAFAIPLFAVFVDGWWKVGLLVPGIVIAVLPAQNKQIREYGGYLLAMLGRRQRPIAANGVP